MQEFLFLLGCTTPFDCISLCVGILSIFLAVVSIGYAVKCNKDSNKLNKQTSDMLMDMQYMMTFNLRIVSELQQRIPKKDLPPNTVCLKKDGIEIHKLTTFNKENSTEVMKLLRELSVKKKTLDYLQKFIEGDSTDYSTYFFSTAETVDRTRLDVIVAELSKYGVLVGFYYNK